MIYKRKDSTNDALLVATQTQACLQTEVIHPKKEAYINNQIKLRT